jgi:hypothetical protein
MRRQIETPPECWLGWTRRAERMTGMGAKQKRLAESRLSAPKRATRLSGPDVEELFRHLLTQTCPSALVSAIYVAQRISPL